MVCPARSKVIEHWKVHSNFFANKNNSPFPISWLLSFWAAKTAKIEDQSFKPDKVFPLCKTEFNPMEPSSSSLGLLPTRSNMSAYQGLVTGGGSSHHNPSSHPHHQPQVPPPDHRRLFNGWNYQPPDPPPLPPPPPGISGQRNGCVSNFSPYSSSLHGVTGPPGLPHSPYGSFGTGADFLQHQFNPLNQLQAAAASHRNLSFYPDLYGHHQTSPGSGIGGRSLLTDLAMPPRFDSDPLGSYIADVGAHHSGRVCFSTFQSGIVCICYYFSFCFFVCTEILIFVRWKLLVLIIIKQ